MDNNYSNEIKIVLNYALEEAARLGSYIATPDHLFLGILRYRESDAVKILEGLGVDVKKVKKELQTLQLTASMKLSKSRLQKQSFLKSR